MQDDITLEALLTSLDEPIEKVAEEEVASVEDTASVGDQLKGLLTKQASDNTTSEEDTDMNKQAKAQGQAIADLVMGMLKQADEGSNEVIRQTEDLVGQQDSATEMTPRSGNTVTETLKDIVARGASEGAVHPDHLALNASPKEEEASHPVLETSDDEPVKNEGTDLDKEAFEKIAAAEELVALGYDFEDAVNLVKEAAEELEWEEGEQIKLATVEALVDEGWDIDGALDLLKQAEEVLAEEAEYEAELEKEAGKVGAAAKALKDKAYYATSTMRGAAKDIANARPGVQPGRNMETGASNFKKRLKASGKEVKEMYKGKGKGRLGSPKSESTKDFRKGVHQMSAAATVPVVAGGAYAVKKKMEKKSAAIEGLMDAGYDLEDALYLLED